MNVPRPDVLLEVERAFEIHPAVALSGPRQCGKTTLARAFAEGRRAAFFDLERPADRARLAEPELALGGLSGWVVLDEVQRVPSLFEVLRVLLDRPGEPGKFLLTGSASPGLVRGVSESLAGRVATIDLGGFHLGEVGAERWRDLWLRGGFPRSFLAPDEAASFFWREEFARTFLERDIPQLGIAVPSEALRRFWTMVAHYHGQLWSGAEFARSLGSSEPTARRYLDILAGTHMVRVLPPWFENLKKRQRRSPKVYLRDSGLLHALLGLPDYHSLTGHPKLGASWEGFALEQVLVLTGARDAYSWATHSGAELDLFLLLRGRRLGFEFKFADAPVPTKSMRVAAADLRLDDLWIVYPGTERYPMDSSITAVPVHHLPALCAEISGR